MTVFKSKVTFTRSYLEEETNEHQLTLLLQFVHNNNKCGTEMADTRDNNLISFIKRAFLSPLQCSLLVVVTFTIVYSIHSLHTKNIYIFILFIQQSSRIFY